MELTESWLVIVLALALDQALGEPHYAHPLAGLGRLATWLEKKIWSDSDGLIRGALAAMALIVPVTLLVMFGVDFLSPIHDKAFMVLESVILYFCVALKSLDEHTRNVLKAMDEGHLKSIRSQVAQIVSRDVAALDVQQLSIATIESHVENLADAVIGAIVWYLLIGIEGAVVYRCVNTLDAMWGYQTQRYRHFGTFSALLDDAMNWPVSWLCGLLYVGCGNSRGAWRCLQQQAHRWSGPNPGRTLSAGAGALGVRLGGPMPYHGRMRKRPVLGQGPWAQPHDLKRCIKLGHHSVLLLVSLLGLLALVTFGLERTLSG